VRGAEPVQVCEGRKFLNGRDDLEDTRGRRLSDLR